MKPLSPLNPPKSWLQLAVFTESLLTEGKVTIEDQSAPFTEEDLKKTGELLKNYYQEDILEMPGNAPAFSETAAVWAAKYLYHAVQLTISREAGENEIKEKLKSFEGAIDASTIYSVDLIFRYLPALFELAKGLSPADILVSALGETIVNWPFSSVGIELQNFSEKKISFDHPSLTYRYIDRVIQHKDLKKAADPVIAGYIREALGQQIMLWPEFKNLLSKT